MTVSKTKIMKSFEDRERIAVMKGGFRGAKKSSHEKALKTLLDGRTRDSKKLSAKHKDYMR